MLCSNQRRGHYKSQVADSSRGLTCHSVSVRFVFTCVAGFWEVVCFLWSTCPCTFFVTTLRPGPATISFFVPTPCVKSVRHTRFYGSCPFVFMFWPPRQCSWIVRISFDSFMLWLFWQHPLALLIESCLTSFCRILKNSSKRNVYVSFNHRHHFMLPPFS